MIQFRQKLTSTSDARRAAMSESPDVAPPAQYNTGLQCFTMRLYQDFLAFVPGCFEWGVGHTQRNPQSRPLPKTTPLYNAFVPGCFSVCTKMF